MTVDTFDRSRIIAPDHPKVLEYAALRHQLASFYANNEPKTNRDVSPQYRAFEATFRMNGIDTAPPNADSMEEYNKVFPDIRSDMSIAYNHPTPKYVNIEPVKYNNVSCYWITLPGQHSWKDGNFIVYLHGGCYVFGDIYTHSGLGAYISQCFNMPLLFIDYKLAPEALFPSQRNECIQVHKALLDIDNTCNKRMILFGESAGGNLSLLYTQAAVQLNSSPRICISLSPYANPLSSYPINRDTELMMSFEQSQWFWNASVGGSKNKDKLRTTEMYLFNNKTNDNSSFKGFPSTIISSGGAELLLCDSEEIYKAMKNENIDVTLNVTQHMCHNFTEYGQLFPEAEIELYNVIQWTYNKLKQ